MRKAWSRGGSHFRDEDVGAVSKDHAGGLLQQRQGSPHGPAGLLTRQVPGYGHHAADAKAWSGNNRRPLFPSDDLLKGFGQRSLCRVRQASSKNQYVGERRPFHRQPGPDRRLQGNERLAVIGRGVEYGPGGGFTFLGREADALHGGGLDATHETIAHPWDKVCHVGGRVNAGQFRPERLGERECGGAATRRSPSPDSGAMILAQSMRTSPGLQIGQAAVPAGRWPRFVKQPRLDRLLANAP